MAMVFVLWTVPRPRQSIFLGASEFSTFPSRLMVPHCYIVVATMHKCEVLLGTYASHPEAARWKSDRDHSMYQPV